MKGSGQCVDVKARSATGCSKPQQRHLRWKRLSSDSTKASSLDGHAAFHGCQVLLQRQEIGRPIAGGKEDALMVSPPPDKVISHFRDKTTFVSGYSEETVSAKGHQRPNLWERSDVLVVFANSFRQADPFAFDPFAFGPVRARRFGRSRVSV